MLKHGGTFLSADDPRTRTFGFLETESGTLFEIDLARVHEGLNSEENQELRLALLPLIREPQGRRKLGFLLSVRDLPGAIQEA